MLHKWHSAGKEIKVAKYRIVSKGNLVTIKSKLSRTDKVSEREMEFVLHNYTAGLFKVFYEGKKQITYTAPMSLPLEKYLTNKMIDQTSFWKIILQIVEVVQAIEINGLYQNKLLMDFQTVFINEVKQELYFIYPPLEKVQNNANVYAFICDITYRELKKYAGTQCDYLIDFEQFLRNGNNYRLENIYAYIENVSPETCQQTRGMGGGRSGFLTTDIINYREHYEKEKENNDTVCLGQDATTMLGDLDDEEGGTTTLLAPTVEAVLIHAETGERITISKENFEVGKSKNNDYCIQGNSTVSRRHAVIVRKNDEFYIYDVGSTNGTRINGQRIAPKEQILLADGDEIVLADEKFTIEIN